MQSLTMTQCPNITEMTLQDNQPNVACAEHREWAIAHILDVRPTLVILSHSTFAALADDDMDRSTAWRDGLTTIVRQVPGIGRPRGDPRGSAGAANLQSCATTVNNPTDCVPGTRGVVHNQRIIEHQVASATGIKAIDPEAWFCLDQRCPSFIGTTPVYGDGAHMTAEYSTRIGPDVVASILAP